LRLRSAKAVLFVMLLLAATVICNVFLDGKQ